MVDSENMDAMQAHIQQTIADFGDGKISLFELIRSGKSGDYWSHIQVFRLATIIMQDPTALKALSDDLNQKIEQAKEIGVDRYDIEECLTRKDGRRRFLKLTQQRAYVFNGAKSLLSGPDFEGSLRQYKNLISHVENLWDSACQTYKSNNFPISAFLSILTIEEIGKLSNLYLDLLFYDAPRGKAVASIVDRDHRRKHFIGVVSGALINARLDRVLGKDVVRKLLHDAESDELEKTRQSCLYIDVRDGDPVTPGQLINEERARNLVVLSGELMAEVLGHFPWEFERMIENVIAFEGEIGMPASKIAL